MREVRELMMQVEQECAGSLGAGQAAFSMSPARGSAWMTKQALPLQLHCCSVRIQKPHQADVALQAEPSDSMCALLKLFQWTLPANLTRN